MCNDKVVNEATKLQAKFSEIYVCSQCHKLCHTDTGTFCELTGEKASFKKAKRKIMKLCPLPVGHVWGCTACPFYKSVNHCKHPGAKKDFWYELGVNCPMVKPEGLQLSIRRYPILSCMQCSRYVTYGTQRHFWCLRYSNKYKDGNGFLQSLVENGGFIEDICCLRECMDYDRAMSEINREAIEAQRILEEMREK